MMSGTFPGKTDFVSFAESKSAYKEKQKILDITAVVRELIQETFMIDHFLIKWASSTSLSVPHDLCMRTNDSMV